MEKKETIIELFDKLHSKCIEMCGEIGHEFASGYCTNCATACTDCNGEGKYTANAGMDDEYESRCECDLPVEEDETPQDD